ncbi:MAG: hypothetical protein Tsb0020_18120 [Haliangiales bacterium]
MPNIPREEWAQHPRFPAQTLLLDSHQSFRRRAVWIRERIEAIDPSGSATLGRRQRWRRRMGADFHWWMRGMRGHEHYEERKLYPYLGWRYECSFDHLRYGHRILHVRQSAVSDAFRTLDPGAASEAARFADLLAAFDSYEQTLLAHLREEEDEIIPLLLALDPADFRAYTESSIDVLLSGAGAEVGRARSDST